MRLPRPNLRSVAYVAAVAVASGPAARAQDLHFSHLAAVPTQTNPAYTGLLEQRARVGVSYRSQWDNFTEGFKTATLSADMKTYQAANGALGVGLYVNSDRAGDLGFATQQVGMSGAYLMAVDAKTYVSLGIQGTYNAQRIDWSAAEGLEFEPLQLRGNGRAGYLGVSSGAAVFQRVTRRLAWFGGLAGGNLNRPDASFLGDGRADDADLLYRRWTFHGGAEIQFGRFNAVRPSVLYLHQGPNRQMKIGSYYRYRADRGISTDAQLAAHFGIFVRHSFYADAWTADALVLALRFDWHDTIITASFDTNVSSLTAATNGVGGPEISLVQHFDWGQRRSKRTKLDCPTFQY